MTAYLIKGVSVLGGEPTDLEEPADDAQGGPAEGEEDEDEEAPARRRGARAFSSG